MIKITGLKGNIQYINPDLIEKIDITPETAINLLNGHRYFVGESAEEIVERIVEFRAKCNHNIMVNHQHHADN